MNIVIVSGTARENRKSHFVAAYLQKTLVSMKQEVHLVDVKHYNLPLLDYKFDLHPNPSKKLIELHSIIDKADAYIFVTPEYNGGPSGALKNTLDYFRKEYKNKVIGISTVSNGAMGGMRAATTMQLQALYYEGFPIPRVLNVADVDQLFSEKGELLDEKFNEKTARFLGDFLWLADAVELKKNKKQHLIA
jgi:NAD(P)H-dependent FMN reductase